MRFDDGFLCNRCGYNLSGLSSDGRCPECGTPVTCSEEGDALRAADVTWLRHIGRGQRKIVGAATLVIVVHVLFVFSADVLKAWLSPFVFDASLPAARLVVQAWLLVGVIELTRQDPRVTLVESRPNVRLLVRVGAALALCLAPVSGEILGASGSSAFLRELPRGAYFLALLLTLSGATVYVSQLALRIPEKKLAEISRSVGIGLGVTAIIYLFAAFLLPRVSIAQGFDRSILIGTLALLRTLFGFAVLCYLLRAMYLWWSFRRVLNEYTSRA